MSELIDKAKVLALIEHECPHEPDEHAEGCCDVCDYAFALSARVEECAAREAAADQGRETERARAEATPRRPSLPACCVASGVGVCDAHLNPEPTP